MVTAYDAKLLTRGAAVKLARVGAPARGGSAKRKGSAFDRMAEEAALSMSRVGSRQTAAEGDQP